MNNPPSTDEQWSSGPAHQFHLVGFYDDDGNPLELPYELHIVRSKDNSSTQVYFSVSIGRE
jgi:hypothetical protein